MSKYLQGKDKGLSSAGPKKISGSEGEHEM